MQSALVRTILLAILMLAAVLEAGTVWFSLPPPKRLLIGPKPDVRLVLDFDNVAVGQVVDVSVLMRRVGVLWVQSADRCFLCVLKQADQPAVWPAFRRWWAFRRPTAIDHNLA